MISYQPACTNSRAQCTYHVSYFMCRVLVTPEARRAEAQEDGGPHIYPPVVLLLECFLPGREIQGIRLELKTLWGSWERVWKRASFWAVIKETECSCHIGNDSVGIAHALVPSAILCSVLHKRALTKVVIPSDESDREVEACQPVPATLEARQ